MKKLILGLGIGVGIGAGLYCLVRRMYNNGQLDDCCDKVGKFLSKSKRTLRNATDAAVNEAEYIKDRIEDKLAKK